MRAFAAAFVAALAAAAMTLSGATAGISSSGLVGRVLRGPDAPVCVHYWPCVVPASVVVEFLRDGREIARVKSTARGGYRITLAPGVYSVRPALRYPLWRLLPQRVKVPAGRYARVNFVLDIGIR